MKYSYQREAILKVVQESYGHLTAKEVYEQVRAKIPNVSLGTVYRNLNLLDELGLVRKITVPYDSDKFDYCTMEHSHIFCIQCHQLFDLESKLNDKMKQFLRDITGYKITNIGVVFQGVCHECQKEKEG